MNELTITKEKVLEAASKCSTAKATLQVLFPEVFKDGITYDDCNIYALNNGTYVYKLHQIEKHKFSFMDMTNSFYKRGVFSTLKDAVDSEIDRVKEFKTQGEFLEWALSVSS